MLDVRYRERGDGSHGHLRLQFAQFFLLVFFFVQGRFAFYYSEWCVNMSPTWRFALFSSPPTQPGQC